MGNTMRELYQRLMSMSAANRDYVIGAGSALDMMPYRITDSFYGSDVDAMRSDWQKVGDDLWQAIIKAEAEKSRVGK